VNLINDKISTIRRISGNISDRPNGLFLNVFGRRREKLDENRDGTGVDDHPRLSGGSAGDVGQGPGGLELQRCVVGRAEELDETRHDTCNIESRLHRQSHRSKAHLQPKNIGVNSTVILNLQVCPWIRLRHGVVTYEVLARFLREYKVVADNIIRFPPSPP
jgi:hypothetical protein